MSMFFVIFLSFLQFAKIYPTRVNCWYILVLCSFSLGYMKHIYLSLSGNFLNIDQRRYGDIEWERPWYKLTFIKIYFKSVLYRTQPLEESQEEFFHFHRWIPWYQIIFVIREHAFNLFYFIFIFLGFRHSDTNEFSKLMNHNHPQ